MEPIIVTLKKEHLYLSEALLEAGYDNIPSNAIINKTLTGIGATYQEIKAERHSIIIEPNVPVIKGKTESHPECFGVYKRQKVSQLVKYLQSPTPTYKKILSTPESFRKITEAAQEAGINIYADFFCLFDECEKIGQDLDYRENITLPLNDFFRFDNKAFVSATPLKLVHKEFDNQNFNTFIITPDFDYKVPLELIITDNVETKALEKIQSLLSVNSKYSCIFYNSTKGIKQFIDQLALSTDAYSVFCSEKSKNELKQKNIDAYTDFNPLYLKTVNFFTSRYYSAVDFHLAHCPDVIMITDLNTASHSTIDPLSEAIQIQGRFRDTHPNGKRFNSLSHITNLQRFECMSHEESVEELNTWYQTAKYLQEEYNNTTNINTKNSLEKDFKKCNIYPYLENPNLSSQFKRNTFSIINRYNKDRVKAYYSEDNLKHAYECETAYFDLTYTDDRDKSFNFDSISNEYVRRFQNSKTPQNQIIQNVIDQLNKDITANSILSCLKEQKYAERHNDVLTVIEAYKLLGPNKLKTTFKAIETDYQAAKLFQLSETKRFSPEVIAEISSEFREDLNKPILKTEANSRLQMIFDKYSLIKNSGKPFKVTDKTIHEYFNAKSNNQNRTYTLINVLPELISKIQSNNTIEHNG